jgi:ABC-type oligopeptide transport system ATPase subunit
MFEGEVKLKKREKITDEFIIKCSFPAVPFTQCKFYRNSHPLSGLSRQNIVWNMAFIYNVFKVVHVCPALLFFCFKKHFGILKP